MRVAVKLFAAARDLAGTAEIEVELASGDTIADLRDALFEQCPALQSLLAHALFAVDTQFATEETLLTEQNEVACIPPVSGG